MDSKKSMDHTPTSKKKRPRESFSPVPEPAGSLFELFVGSPSSLDFDTRAVRPTPCLSTAGKSPHSKTKQDRAARSGGAVAPVVHGSRRASTGGNERPSSADSAESDDSDASALLVTSRKADRFVVGARKRRLVLQEEDEETQTRNKKMLQPSKDVDDQAPENFQWKDDSNDSDYVDDDQEEQSLGEEKGGDVGSGRKGPSTPTPRLAAGRLPIYRPPRALSIQKVATKSKKKRGTPQVAASLKGEDIDSDGSIEDDVLVSTKGKPAERSRSTTANRRLDEHDEEEATDPAYRGDSNASDDESTLSFPKDDSLGSADNGVWTTLGGFIDGLSGNKPVHLSTRTFGMQVIEEEYNKAKDRLRRAPSSSTGMRRCTVSLAQIKPQIYKAVRARLRSSLPEMYVRVEDPCNHDLAKQTIARQSRTQQESDAALRLAKHLDRFAKQAEKLEKQIDDLNQELEREPSDVYTIHPHLRIDPPAASEEPSLPRAGPKLQFRQAPDSAANVFLESLFPSSNN
jgi:hypothetical protein